MLPPAAAETRVRRIVRWPRLDARSVRGGLSADGRTPRAAARPPARAGQGRLRSAWRSCSARLLAHPVVAALLEFEGERAIARSQDATVVEYVHEIRLDVVEQALVMSDQDDRATGCAQAV